MTGETVSEAEAAPTPRRPVRKRRSQRWIWVLLSLLAVLLLGGGISLPLILHQSDSRQYADVIAESITVRDDLREVAPRADAAELIAHLRVEASDGAVETLQTIGDAEEPILTPEVAEAVSAAATTLSDARATAPAVPDPTLVEQYDAALVADDSTLPTSPFDLEVDDVVVALDIRPSASKVRPVPEAEVGAKAIADARSQLEADRTALEETTSRFESAVSIGDGVAASVAASLGPVQAAAESVPEQAEIVFQEYFAAVEEHEGIVEAATTLEDLLAEEASVSDADRALRLASGVANYVTAADAAREAQEEYVEQTPETTPSDPAPQVPGPSDPGSGAASAEGTADTDSGDGAEAEEASGGAAPEDGSAAGEPDTEAETAAG